jgi:hypothetical protein
MLSSIKDALEAQAHIGWLAELKGFLSNHWTILASMSMTTASDRNHMEGLTRLRHALNLFHAFSQSIWNGRNEHDSVNRTTLHRTRMEDIEIKHYNVQNFFPPQISTTANVPSGRS